MKNIVYKFGQESSSKMKRKRITHTDREEKTILLNESKFKRWAHKNSCQQTVFQSNSMKLATDVWWEHIIGLKIVLTVAAYAKYLKPSRIVAYFITDLLFHIWSELLNIHINITEYSCKYWDYFRICMAYFKQWHMTWHPVGMDQDINVAFEITHMVAITMCCKWFEV